MTMSLAQQQAALLAALWQPRLRSAIELVATNAVPFKASDPKHLERGLAAYRGNGLALAVRGLAAAYPVVAACIGPENFERLAHQCWLRHPPERGDLAQWGRGLPGLIESLPGLAEEEPHLADVARVEWALHAAAAAADGHADAASVSLLTEHDPSALRLQLAWGTQLVANAYPVTALVLAHLEGTSDAEQLHRSPRQERPEVALVWRHGLRPRLRAAMPGEAAFIAALLEDRSLAGALDAAPDFDFAAWLAPAVQSGLLLKARVTTMMIRSENA